MAYCKDYNKTSGGEVCQTWINNRKVTSHVVYTKYATVNLLKESSIALVFLAKYNFFCLILKVT